MALILESANSFWADAISKLIWADSIGIKRPYWSFFPALTGRTIEQSEGDFAGKGYGDFKAGVAEVVVDYLNPVRERANELLKDETHLKNLLKIGAEKAEAVASKTLADVYNAMGLIPRG